MRDLQAELLDMVCYDVQLEPAQQPITGEDLARGTNHATNVPLDVYCLLGATEGSILRVCIACAISTQTLIEILAPSKSTGFMKMNRSDNTILLSQK